MRVLLIDDDPDTHDIITPYLRSKGADVHSAYDGLSGIQAARQYQPHLIILDVQLPKLDGWEVCRQVRAFSYVPIVMITAVALSIDDSIRGLDTGADDYLIKPLHLDMLNARISAILRRLTRAKLEQPGNQFYSDAHLTLDMNRQIAIVEGQRVNLSRLEYLLLELLVINAGQTVPTEEIIEALWSDSSPYDEYAAYVRAYIRRLRHLIEPKPDRPIYIINEHGMGYRFDPSQ